MRRKAAVSVILSCAQPPSQPDRGHALRDADEVSPRKPRPGGKAHAAAEEVFGHPAAVHAASGEDLATVSDIVTDSLTAFGLTAADTSRYADILAQTATKANTNVSMMGETFKYAAPLAGALGYDVEDVAVATGLMANAGIKGSEAGTTLRNIFTRLAKPTKESADAMKALGLSMSDGTGHMYTWMELMEKMRDQFAGLTEEEQTLRAAELAGQRSMSGLLAIVNASEEDFAKLSAAISEVYTHINMDSRFHYEGEGQWGLIEWAPPEVKRTHTSSRSTAAGSKGSSKASRRKEKLFESIQE